MGKLGMLQSTRGYLQNKMEYTVKSNVTQLLQLKRREYIYIGLFFNINKLQMVQLLSSHSK